MPTGAGFAKALLCLALFTSQVIPQTTTTPPPTALVTFYSSGKNYMLMPGSKSVFKGKIFYEDQQLALLGGHRFVTFKLPVGFHKLSSNWWMTTGPAGGPHITINLQADRHYYISTGFQEVGFGGTQIIMQEVTCEDAQQAKVGLKPLEAKHLHEYGSSALVSETSFPSCS